MTRRRLRAAILAAALALLSCGGGDGPTNPPGNGGNGSLVTLLDASRPEDWIPSCSSCYRDWERCSVRGGVFTVADTTRYDSAERACLSSAFYGCTWTSRTHIDFRPYESARLQFSVRVTDYGSHSIVWAVVHSNVPGTPDLPLPTTALLPREPYATWEQLVDISLENALTFREATLELGLRHRASAAPTPTFPPECRGRTSASIHGMKIVARPRTLSGAANP